MKYLCECKKDYHDKFNTSNPIFKKGSLYSVEVSQDSDKKSEYDQLLVTYTRKYEYGEKTFDKPFLRYMFDDYFYTKQELREKVINELLK